MSLRPYLLLLTFTLPLQAQILNQIPAKHDFLVQPTTANLLAQAAITPTPALVPTQPDETGIDLLEEITVTATRRPVKLRDTSSSIYTISRAEIERKGATNVGEAIRGVPGVQSNIFGSGADVHGNFFIRGQPNLGLGVLIDGRLITNLNQEHFDLADIPVYNVERIEVLTGSGATLYGSNATGGVINIITRQPSAIPEGEVRAEFGSYGFSNYIASYSGKSGALGYGASYRQFNASNDYYYQVERPTGLFTGIRPNGDTQLKNYTFNLSYDFNERNRLHVDTYVRNSLKGVGPFTIIDPSRPLLNDEGEPQFELTRLDTQSYGVALTYDSELGQGKDSQLQVLAAIDHNRLVEKAAFDAADLGEFTDVAVLNFQVRHNWQFNPTNNITYGVEYVREFGSSGAVDNSVFSFDVGAGRPALFALYTWQPSRDFLVTAGARETIPEPFTVRGLTRNFSSSFDPTLGTRWQITPTLALRANFQTIYRVPNFNDLFGRTTHIGNPFLDPTTGSSFDIGFDWQTGHDSLARLTYFHSDLYNLVDYLLVRDDCAGNGNAEGCNDDPATNAERFRVGYPHVSTSGLEGAFTWRVNPTWNLFSTLTLTDARILDAPDPTLVDNQLINLGTLNGSDEGLYRVDAAERDALIQTQYPLVPYATARLGVTYEEPTGLQVSVFANLSGQRSVDVNHVGPFDTTHPARLPPGSLIPGYTTFDLSARFPLNSGLLLTAYVDNLLGTYYERSYGNAAPGFNFRVGLTYRF